jgi:hypothetical protein
MGLIEGGVFRSRRLALERAVRLASALSGGRMRLAVLGACRSFGAETRVSSQRESRPPVRPVLKHGPRSLTCARVIGW